MVAAQMQRSMLVTGHGGTAALRGGALAVSGHGKSRRGAHEFHGDDVTLLRLPWLGEMLRRDLPAYAVALRVVFHTGEAMAHHNVML